MCLFNLYFGFEILSLIIIVLVPSNILVFAENEEYNTAASEKRVNNNKTSLTLSNTIQSTDALYYTSVIDTTNNDTISNDSYGNQSAMVMIPQENISMILNNLEIVRDAVDEDDTEAVDALDNIEMQLLTAAEAAEDEEGAGVPEKEFGRRNPGL